MKIQLIIFLVLFVLVPFLFIRTGWKAKKSICNYKDSQDIICFVFGGILYLIELRLLIFMLKK